MENGNKAVYEPFSANQEYYYVNIDRCWKRINIAKVLILPILDFWDKRSISVLQVTAPLRSNPRCMENGRRLAVLNSSQAYGSDLRSGIGDLQKGSRNYIQRAVFLSSDLGGIGCVASTWMVDHGACEAICMSRSPVEALSKHWSYRQRRCFGFYHKLKRQWPVQLSSLVATLRTKLFVR